MKKYDHLKIEHKWQGVWEKKASNKAKDPGGTKQKKFYALIEFPYPSGAGLHVGHIRSNTAMDVIARKRRAEGFNVLYPIGWDAFGLPTENFAIKTGTPPAQVTKQNTDTFRKQLKSLGFSFDWSREINTTDPKYYKWTQWIFLQLFKKGLAYKAKTTINWCPKDKIGLANEEVVDGCCERCGTPVEKRVKEQWMLAITKYADRLDKDLDKVDYLEQIKTQQRNWIGKSEGALIKFKIQKLKVKSASENSKVEELEVFTTRPDTLFGATYLVLAPEHETISKLKSQISNWDEILRYIAVSKKKSEIERTNADKAKTGVELKGLKAVNPANKEEIPVWIADYVLADYGTGAIMAVPAHDERDFAFATCYHLPIIKVIAPQINAENYADKRGKSVYTGYGVLINSGKFDDLDSEKAKKEITKFVGGKIKTTYKLRDWVFSRQRYWGEPIPLIYCAQCAQKSKAQKNADATQKNAEGEKLNPGWFAMDEKDLPLTLPGVKKYKPTDTGESPLAAVTSWVKTKCPNCKGEARRETDTMPNWAGSSWYYLRYTDPENDKALAGKKKLDYWTPVDWYNGGMEHTTLHLLYSRFWHKFLYDIKVVKTSEPYQKRTSHGLILAEDGNKMSKSKGNVVNPDDIVKTWGADTLRLYEMFMGPFDQAIAWNSNSLIGPRRFLEKVWRMQEKISKKTSKNDRLESLVQQTIKKVSTDIESMAFNTAVSAMMILTNELDSQEQISLAHYQTLLRLLAPFAPHVTEELWLKLGNKESIHEAPWPKFDTKKIKQDKFTVVVQVNGKVRDSFETDKKLTEAEAGDQAMALLKIKKWLEGKEVRKIIYVPNKLINIVIG